MALLTTVVRSFSARRDVAAAFVMRAAAAALSYVIFALIGRNAAIDVFSSFALLFAIVGFCGPLAAMGQSTILLRYLPPLFERGDGGWWPVVRNSLTVLALGLLIFCIGAMLFARASMAGSGPPILLAVAVAVALAGVTEYTFSLQRSSGSVLPAIFAKELLWRVALIGLVLGHLALGQPLSVEALFVYFTLALFASMAMSVRDAVLRLSRRWSLPVGERIAIPVTQSAVFFGITALNMALTHMDTLILGALATAEDIGPYFSAQRTVQILYFFSYSYNMLMIPAVSIALRNGAADEVTRLSRQVSRQAGGFAVLFCLVLIVFAGDILAIFNPAFRADADILRILCIGPLVYTLGGLHSSIPQLCGIEGEYLIWRLGIAAAFNAAKVAAAAMGEIALFAVISSAEVCAVTVLGVVLARWRQRIWAI